MRSISRRRFLVESSLVSLSAFLPRQTSVPTTKTQKVAIHTDAEIGIVRPELHGHFAEHLGSCVYGGLWVGRDSKIPNIQGYRKLAVEYLQALGVPVLRWPGGCFADDYHWREGIGPAERRPKRVNIHWGGYVEDNSFGTHEFIGLCRQLGAEPYLAGNVGSGSPTEMRDWLEYCNYPEGSALSDERIANGEREPFRVRYWGVGNESWGCGGNMKAEEYAAEYRRFAVYLKELGGTKPFLIASGPSGADIRWSRGVLDNLKGELPDGLSMHYYEGGRQEPTQFDAEHMNEQLAIFKEVERAIELERSVLDGYPRGKKVGLILDEWGVWDQIPEQDEKQYGALWQQSTMRSALAAGLGLNLFNRLADKLYMCNIAQIVNVLQSLLLTGGANSENCVRTTTYYAFQLFKPHRSKTAVLAEMADSGDTEASVSASKGNGQLAISYVNPYPDRELRMDCALLGATAKSGKAEILHHPDLNAYNSFEKPDTVSVEGHGLTVEKDRVQVNLPPLSVVTARVELRA